MEQLPVEKFDSWDELYGPWFKCPKCNESTLMPEWRFCSSCGQAVEWPASYKEFIKR